MTRPLVLLAIAALALPAAALAKESLGVFDGWGAFRDPATPRCYAIAKALPSQLARDYEPYASVGTWPRLDIRGQIHFRLSRAIRADRSIRLRVGGQSYKLTGGGGDAWAQDRSMDAAIVAQMRSARRMTVSATDTRGRRFSNSYDLAGAPTAMDAATIACSRL